MGDDEDFDIYNYGITPGESTTNDGGGDDEQEEEMLFNALEDDQERDDTGANWNDSIVNTNSQQPQQHQQQHQPQQQQHHIQQHHQLPLPLPPGHFQRNGSNEGLPGAHIPPPKYPQPLIKQLPLPPSFEEKKEQTAIYIGNLTWWTTDQNLEDLVTEVGGKPKQVRFFEDKVNGKSKGYALVEFATPEMAAMVKEKLQNKEINGRPCMVNFASAASFKQPPVATVGVPPPTRRVGKEPPKPFVPVPPGTNPPYPPNIPMPFPPGMRPTGPGGIPGAPMPTRGRGRGRGGMPHIPGAPYMFNPDMPMRYPPEIGRAHV